MHDTKMYEAESDSTKKLPRISHKVNDWLINQISTGISLPIRIESLLVYNGLLVIHAVFFVKAQDNPSYGHNENQNAYDNASYLTSC